MYYIIGSNYYCLRVGRAFCKNIEFDEKIEQQNAIIELFTIVNRNKYLEEQFSRVFCYDCFFAKSFQNLTPVVGNKILNTRIRYHSFPLPTTLVHRDRSTQRENNQKSLGLMLS